MRNIHGNMSQSAVEFGVVMVILFYIFAIAMYQMYMSTEHTVYNTFYEQY